MDIGKIKTNSLTEQRKMELLADYLGKINALGLDEVLANGDTATHKTAKIVDTDNAHNFASMSETQLYTQKEYADGAAIAQLTSDGKLSLDYDPEQGNPTYFTIEVNEGTPKVLMSDDVKAAFKAALGIN